MNYYRYDLTSVKWSRDKSLRLYINGCLLVCWKEKSCLDAHDYKE